MLPKKFSMFLFLVVVFLFAGQPAGAELVVFTSDEDFNMGDLQNVTPENDQLQLKTTETKFAFVNVAATARGTLIRIDAQTGDIIGEYKTAPEDHLAEPSRTTVDKLGSVWVANADFYEFGESPGSVVKIGIVIGGTRENADGTTNDIGEYVTSYDPDHTTCVDRDGDGRIRTSADLGDILPWTGDVPEDECILIYKEFKQLGVIQYHVSVDAENNVWVGEYPPNMFYKLDGKTGDFIEEDQFDAAKIDEQGGCGGWGGLVDGNAILWSASPGENKILRYNPETKSGNCISIEFGPWGLGLDTSGNIWTSLPYSYEIAKFDPDGILVGEKISRTEFIFPEGVAVTPIDDNIWVANGGGYEVLRLNNQGNLLSSIYAGDHPTGVAVDANGMVWVVNLGSENVVRIDPSGNTEALTISLGAGAGPDNYGNMAGVVGLSEIAPQGTWTIIRDSGLDGNTWDTIFWNSEAGEAGIEQPEGTLITVAARAADSDADSDEDSDEELADQEFMEIGNNVPFLLTGRFIEIRVTLEANDQGQSPILTDLKVDVTTPPESLVCDVDQNGSVNIFDIFGILFTLKDDADGPDDPRDWDGDGKITMADVKGCTEVLTQTQCVAEDFTKTYTSAKHWGSKKKFKVKKVWKLRESHKTGRH
jgi:streptogramin lyase